MASSPITAFTLGLLLIVTLVGNSYGDLRLNYYANKCGKYNVETVASKIVKKYFDDEADTVADLVRLQFHDCAVDGCDASILLEGPHTELRSKKDSTVAGLDIVEEIKVTLDKYCPGVVSCADIIVLAARAAVSLGGAKWYEVETGRKDGRYSSATRAQSDLPSPNIPVTKAIELFKSYGLNTEDFVVLLGCHTVGEAHCDSFEDRLYNYGGYGKSDPSIEKAFLAKLKETCPYGAHSDEEAFLDQTKGSEFKMDNGFYKRILEGKGLLKIDQLMASDPQTKDIVKTLAKDNGLFAAKIGPAMRKMAKIGVNLSGEVRLGTCKKVRY